MTAAADRMVLGGLPRSVKTTLRFPKLLANNKTTCEKEHHMKRIRLFGLPLFSYTAIFCTLVVSTIGTSSGLAADNNAKVTLVYEHVLPNVPGKSIKGILVEYGPGGSSPAHTHVARDLACPP